MPKATHTLTTPSRRQLIGGSIVAALTGAAFAGVVVLPDPGEAFPAPASPDTHLLALCAEFFRVDTSVEAVPDDDALSLVMEARDTLAQRISATRAISATGLQAKARVGHFLMNERHCPGTSLDDVDTYALTLLRELMAGTVEPFSVPASPDAELIRLCAECDALQAKVDTLWQCCASICDTSSATISATPNGSRTLGWIGSRQARSRRRRWPARPGFTGVGPAQTLEGAMLL